DELLRLAGAVEDASEHPIARAIAEAARAEAGPLPSVEAFANASGLGVQGLIDGRLVVAGRPRFLARCGMHLSAELESVMAAAESLGHTAVVAGWDGVGRGVIVVADTVKPTSAEAIAGLRSLGLRPVLLTGDNERAARAVA